MKMSELSARSGVPVATVKFYLREGLLPSGTATAATQATYAEHHLDRLRLVRALLGVGGLSVREVRDVVDQLDHPPDELVHLIGVAHERVGTSPVSAATDPTSTVELLRSLGWAVEHVGRDVRQLSAALQALADAGLEPTPELVRRYAAAAMELAETDVGDVPTGSLDAAVRYVVVGTVLLEPVLLALRRIAHIEVATRPDGPLATGRHTGR